MTTFDWERKLTVAGSTASIFGLLTVFLDQQVMETGLTDFLLASIPVPILALAIAPVLLFVAFLLGRGKRPPITKAGLLHLRPTRITGDDPDSAASLPSDLLKCPAGGISMWVLLPDHGKGIRSSGQHRYLFAHATQSEPYRNVVALCLGPANANALGENQWKLWLANSQGVKRTFRFADSAEITPGWHHVLVRWRERSSRIEVLIDGIVVIQGADYEAFWPRSLAGQIVIGAWAIRDWRVNFAETHFWRTQLVGSFPDDEWVHQERQIAPPSEMLVRA